MLGYDGDDPGEVGMREVILQMSISLDGYFEGPHHELDWQLVDDELHQHFNDQLRGLGGLKETRTFGSGVVLLRYAVH